MAHYFQMEPEVDEVVIADLGEKMESGVNLLTS
jgi:hypothetical protein